MRFVCLRFLIKLCLPNVMNDLVWRLVLHVATVFQLPCESFLQTRFNE